MFHVDDVLHCDLKRSLDPLLTIALFHDVAETKNEDYIYQMRPKEKNPLKSIYTT